MAQRSTFFAVGRAAKDRAAFAFAGDDFAVGPDQAEGHAVVFAHGDEQMAVGRECEAFEAVVRIVVFGVEPEDRA